MNIFNKVNKKILALLLIVWVLSGCSNKQNEIIEPLIITKKEKIYIDRCTIDIQSYLFDLNGDSFFNIKDIPEIKGMTLKDQEIKIKELILLLIEKNKIKENNLEVISYIYDSYRDCILKEYN